MIIITGISGQDGSLLLEYLLKNTDHFIIGTTRNIEKKDPAMESHLHLYPDRLHLENLNILDQDSIKTLIQKTKPDYFIHFAAQSLISESWIDPFKTFQSNSFAVLSILENIRLSCPHCRFLSCGSSEEFGKVEYEPQDLAHPMKPRNPYGASKCAERFIIHTYRECFNLYALHCIFFNHEGTNRSHSFVTRKITSSIARIKHEILRGDKPTPFYLGNIFTQRDWSDSEDFMRAVWLMLNQEQPREYLLASGESHTLKEFIDLTCQFANLDVQWELNETDPLQTKLLLDDDIIMTIDEKFFRPNDKKFFVGDPSETETLLSYKPKISFYQLVEKMYWNDYHILKKKD